MGLLGKLVGVVLAVLIIAGVVVGGAVASGYVLIGDPVEASQQVVTGDITQPDGGLGTSEGGTIDKATAIRPVDVSTESVTLEANFYVDNRPNEIGGQIDVLEYQVLWSPSESGEFEPLGDGQINELEVRPATLTTESTEFEAQYSDAPSIAEFATRYVAGESIYIRVTGTAELNMGPFGFGIPFDQVVQLQ